MKLATFTEGNFTRIGRVAEDMSGIVDLAKAAPELPQEMVAFLSRGDEAMARARAADSPVIPFERLVLESPVLRPPKFLGIGMNYAAHVAEAGHERPANQMWFAKQPLSITGPRDPIVLPEISRALDYECELAIVIGRTCHRVPAEEAHEVVAGYTICNDGSVRDWQFKSPTTMLGKSFDHTSPVGPWIVTPDEIGNPHDLGLKTWVNGELRQDARTSQLLFNCWEMIAELSAAFTLEPGDILATGTPQGVGAAMKPMQFLKAGDLVRMEIEKIGMLENPVVAEGPEIVSMFYKYIKTID
ncbi:fumarylacetoacetate hydrolase family protein [Parvibaculum sp.]|uniref:fumarylacetoacetate hydrolase family protein n=1 Tax=Parvibaculum sp. TaxID=2024848 RepID=UPI00391D68BA